MATLKISDLSVGDWVRYGGMDYQVKGIDASLERVTLMGCKEQRDESIYALHPILITAEILEKNGWPMMECTHFCALMNIVTSNITSTNTACASIIAE